MQTIELLTPNARFFVKLAPGLAQNDEAQINITLHFETISAQPIYKEWASFVTPKQAQAFINEYGKTEAKKVLKRFFNSSK